MRDYVHKYTQGDLKADDYEWVPCRYSVLGWKQQAKGTVQSHLNHPNKRNAMGYG